MCFRYLMNNLTIGFLLLFFSSVIFGDDYNNQLSLGSSHTCFLKNDNVICWGDNRYGQSTPPSLSNPKLISVYSKTSCALDDTGVVCWGARAEELNARNWGNPSQLDMNWAGECVVNFDGVTCWDNQDPPVSNRIASVPELINPIQVSVAYNRVCALDDTGLVCWGDSATYLNDSEMPKFKNPRSVKLSNRLICVLDDTGVICIDRNGTQRKPLKNSRHPSPAIQFDIASDFGCALQESGVQCYDTYTSRFGIQNYGQLRPPKLTNPVHVSVDYGRACAIDGTGVVCWGANKNGESTVPNLNIPFQISGGTRLGCALYENGIQCWGKIGGKFKNLASSEHVSVGTDHYCVLSDGQVNCWRTSQGRRPATFGQAPRKIPDLINPTQIAAGDSHSCAIDDTGVVCWGGVNSRDNPMICDKDRTGMLLETICPYSDKENSAGNNIPTLINPTYISANGITELIEYERDRNVSGKLAEVHFYGDYRTCAIDNTGVVCWGRNGEIIETPKLSNPAQVDVGQKHTCALDETGVTCWGNNEFGQLDVPELDNPTQIAVGYNHTCALDDTGVVCWGKEKLSVKGFDTEEEYNITLPPELINPTQISAKGSGSCALDDTGVVCWGQPALWGSSSVGRPISIGSLD